MMRGLPLITGESRNSTCEDCISVYDPRKYCSMKTAVRVLCLILLILSVLEMCLEACVFIMSSFSSEGLNAKVNIGFLQIGSVVTFLCGCLRLGSIYYMYSTLKETTEGAVIAARGLCICNSTLTTSLLFMFLSGLILTGNMDFFIRKDPNLTRTFDRQLVFIFLIIVLCIDFLFILTYGICTVEAYRIDVKQANTIPTVRMSAWANRNNDKYRTDRVHDEETAQ